MPACYTQRKFMPLIDRAFAENFAAQWIAAWNSHDLERIFALYSDDFVMCSPLIAERGFAASGSLRGKAAIRPYWSAGLAATPPIRFELVDVYVGVDTIAIQYDSVSRGKRVVEVLEFDAERRVVSGSGCYAAWSRHSSFISSSGRSVASRKNGTRK